jgi:hypothetical protein
MRYLSASLFRVVPMMLLLFTLLAFVTFLFSDRISDIEGRKNALLLADQIVSSWDQDDYPEIGVFDSTAVSGVSEFEIRRIVSEVSPGVREMHVYIGNVESSRLELVRRFYESTN